MEFRILGPIELEVNGTFRDLGSAKERCVLAILLWELGRPVANETLINRVWGSDRPDRALPSLYSYVSRLRANLKSAVGDRTRVVRWQSGSYTLQTDPETVDLHRFRKMRDLARGLEGNDDEGAASLLREAANLWRGTPLAGLHGGWAAGARATLEEERFTAIIRRIQIELRLGLHTDLVPELSGLVAQHPLNQELAGHLMVTLYRCGRQAEALEAFRSLRHRLIEETGTEPASNLIELHQRMLKGNLPFTEERRTHHFRAIAAPNTLPRDNPDFTGRLPELDRLVAVINSAAGRSTSGVVAISGMPGVGKTALAVHAAHMLCDRYPIQMYLSLHAHDRIEEPVDPGSALGVLLRALGEPADNLPAGVEERAALWRTRLAGRRALIVLDDTDDPDQIRPLLPGAPGCLVLITSRRRVIELPGVFWLPLGTMRPDEAAALFGRIAGENSADDASAVARVTRICGYLPLAIQMAASRFRNHPSWSVTDLAAHLSHGPSELADSRPLPREIASSLELSYRYLTSKQQRIFRQLALSPITEYSVEAAAALADGEGVEAELETILDQHLLEERLPGRYSFHDVIREFAAHLSFIYDKPSDRHGALHRVLDHYLALADKADRIIHPYHHRIDIEVGVSPPLPPEDARNVIELERENLIRLLRYAGAADWPRHAALLSHVLARFLDTWGLWDEAARAHRHAIRAWRQVGDRRGEAVALTELCFVLGRLGQHTEALECANQAFTLCRELQDLRGESDMLDCQGLILWQSSRYIEALSSHDKAYAICLATRDKHGEADALSHGAMPLWSMRRYDEALSRWNRALVIYRQLGDRQGEGNALNNIAETQQELGLLDDALANYLQVLPIFREIGDRQGDAILQNNIGNLCQRTGDYDASIRHLREALGIYREIGDRRCEADALNNIGVAFRRAGHHDEALKCHQRALVIAHEIEEPYQEARSHCHTGDVHVALNHYDSALHDYRVALLISTRIGDAYQEGLARNGLGSVLLHTSGTSAAQGQWREALALFERIGVPEAETVRARLAAASAAPSSPHCR